MIKSKTDITKKTAAKEMEQNEKLSGFKARIQGDINVLEKQGLYSRLALSSINKVFIIKQQLKKSKRRRTS